MSLWNAIKIAIGYERKSHTYDSSRIREGDIKMISKNEMVKNEEGKISICKKDNRGNWKCKRLPIKPR